MAFAPHIGLTNVKETAPKSAFDATATTRKGTEWAIELKNRNQRLITTEDGKLMIEGTTNRGGTYRDETLFIEAHKASSLYFEMAVNNRLPIYINFLSDGTTIIHNLKDLKKMPTNNKKTIWSNGYQVNEEGIRFGLYLDDAFIFDKDGKLIYNKG